MASNDSPTKFSGSLLLLTFLSVAGIVASLLYSGYLAIAIGGFVIALALLTKSPDAQRDRTIVFAMAGVCILLGVGAISLGVVARSLMEISQTL